ncbi:MAG TPA: cysteine desulfurase [Chloroflexota bacterium]|nr:cysteine desulfurase [Chloroflexota bacterium]
MATSTHPAAPIDVAALRAEFPVLERRINGHPLAYLDSAATTLKPRSVLDALDRYNRTATANVHRGVYTLAEEATELYEGARERVAALVNAPSSEQIIYTRNTTEAINLVALSWGRSNLRDGDLIVCSEMEHHSNLVPWQMLAGATGARLEFVPIDDAGHLRLEVLDDLLGQGPRLVAITAVSNVLGTINPVASIIRKAHDAGARVLLDAAQSIPHQPVDVAALDVDWLAFSGHKMYGPTGIGVLYGRRSLLEEMPPVLGGGDMIRRVGLRASTWNDLPWKFEAGTPAIAEAIGLGAAADFLLAAGLDRVWSHERALVEYAMGRLAEIDGVRVYGPPEVAEHGGAISFNVGDVHPHDVASVLDGEGIAIRAGHHCAQPLIERLGVAATSRASVGLYTTTDDIDRLIAGLATVKRVLGVA